MHAITLFTKCQFLAKKSGGPLAAESKTHFILYVMPLNMQKLSLCFVERIAIICYVLFVSNYHLTVQVFNETLLAANAVSFEFKHLGVCMTERQFLTFIIVNIGGRFFEGIALSMDSGLIVFLLAPAGNIFL